MAGELYKKNGAVVAWSDTVGGAITDQLDMGGLAADAMKAGSYLDRGDLAVTPAPDEYEWQLVIDGFDTPPVVGETVDLYFAQGDTSSQYDGQIDATGITDLVEATNPPVAGMLPNLMFAGSAVVHSTTAGDELIARGVVRFTGRYVVPVVHNTTTDDALLSTVDAHILTLTPIYYQAQ